MALGAAPHAAAVDAFGLLPCSSGAAPPVRNLTATWFATAPAGVRLWSTVKVSEVTLMGAEPLLRTSNAMATCGERV